jgi:hypothetical protein
MVEEQIQEQVQAQEQVQEKDKEILVWQKDTWGSFGQHSNIYTFVIDPESLQIKAIYELVTTRHENRDSSKNYHRYTYAKLSEIISKLQGKIIKRVHDYKSSRKREISVSYYLVTADGLKEIKAEKSLRDNKGFFDRLELNDKIIIVRKDSVEVIKK